MKKRRLGRTELLVNEIGVGCWAIGGPFTNLGISGGWDGINFESAKKGLLATIQMGANLFDTADVYGFGKSERLLGWMLEKINYEFNIDREEIAIASKVGYFKGCASHGYDPLHMRHQLEMTLQNLKSEYLDVYFFHHLDFGKNEKYLEGAVDQMKKFREEGLIRYIGLRGPHKFSVLRRENLDTRENAYNKFLRLFSVINPDVISVRYNMISPTYDQSGTDIFHWAEVNNVGVLIYKPLGQGLLLNKYDPNNPPKFSHEDNRNRKPWFNEKGLTVLKKRLDKIGKKFNCISVEDYVQLAIKYCLSRCDSACVLVGFRNEKQIKESLSTTGYLTQEECDYIRRIFQGVSEEIGPFIELSELS